MQLRNKTSLILVIVVLSIFILAILLLISFFDSDKKQNQNIELSEVEKVLNLDERSNGIIFENARITNQSGNFIRGKLIDVQTRFEKDFYLIKIGEGWRVVEITSEPVSCERFARLGFPNTFITDCRLTFSDAVTLSEIDATLEDFFKSSANTNLRIIAVVQSIENTENGQIITLVSGEKIIQVQTLSSDPIVSLNDLIVTNITPPNNNTSSANVSINPIYNVSNVVVVNEQDKDLYNNISTIHNPINQNPNPTTNTEQKINKIDAPKTYAVPSYFFNVNDVDNSFVDIQLEGSF
jgi:hypothetical protein